MHRVLILALLLISAAWLQALEGYPPSNAEQKNASEQTIEGCLQSVGGHYMLTESDGTVHRLSGYANKLVHQVGHEVQITGKPSVKTTSTTSWGAASTAVQQPVFAVKTVTQVADTCKSK